MDSIRKGSLGMRTARHKKEENARTSFSDLIEKFSRERIVFRGAKEEVACAALMLRLEYGRIVASSPSQTPLTVYNVYNPSEELMGRIESMTIPMD